MSSTQLHPINLQKQRIQSRPSKMYRSLMLELPAVLVHDVLNRAPMKIHGFMAMAFAM